MTRRAATNKFMSVTHFDVVRLKPPFEVQYLIFIYNVNEEVGKNPILYILSYNISEKF